MVDCIAEQAAEDNSDEEFFVIIIVVVFVVIRDMLAIVAFLVVAPVMVTTVSVFLVMPFPVRVLVTMAMAVTVIPASVCQNDTVAQQGKGHDGSSEDRFCDWYMHANLLCGLLVMTVNAVPVKRVTGNHLRVMASVPSQKTQGIQHEFQVETRAFPAVIVARGDLPAATGAVTRSLNTHSKPCR
jgi:hypothetical protein